MNAAKSLSVPILIALAGTLVLPVPVLAQSASPRGGTLATYEAGYGNGRAMESRTFDPSTRDANGNRLIINGIIQSDASGQTRSDGVVNGAAVSGADYFSSGASTASTTAVGNLLTVNVDGSWNTVIVNSRQANTGNVTANGLTRPQ